MCPLKPTILSVISFLKPKTIPTEAVITANDRATAIMATITAGEVFLFSEEKESRLDIKRG